MKRKSYYLEAKKRQESGDVKGCYQKFVEGTSFYTRKLLKSISPMSYYDLPLLMIAIEHILQCTKKGNPSAASDCKMLRDVVNLDRIKFHMRVK